VRITQILAAKKPCFSFEFFPPKSDDGIRELMITASTLQPLEPAFVSVTYGAGGGNRSRTLDVVKAMKRDLGLEPMAHLTCIGSAGDELRKILFDLDRNDINNILALRGDVSSKHEQTAKKNTFRYASELIGMINAEFDFCIGGACYPEKHLEAVDFATDIRNLATKVNSGASFLITQLFFDNEVFYSFVIRARRAGISVPIIPGIMPITNAEQINRFTNMCGATIPQGLRKALASRQNEPESVVDLGVAFATLQCVDLLAAGVPGIHFYTLNKSPATRAVVSALLAAKPWEKSAGRRYLESTELPEWANP
jgi:methylenetetrahydrofolate reductase (NADPH)